MLARWKLRTGPRTIHQRLENIMSKRVGRAHDDHRAEHQPHPAPAKAVNKKQPRENIDREPIVNIRDGIEKRIERTTSDRSIEEIENREIERVHLNNVPVAFEKLARNGIRRLVEFRRSTVEMDFAIVQKDNAFCDTLDRKHIVCHDKARDVKPAR